MTMQDSQQTKKPTKPFAEALYDFLCMAAKRPQDLIIPYFVEQVIKHSDVCDQGSIGTTQLVPKDRVFIVHGHDERFRQELEDILNEEKIVPVVIQAFARTGQDLLQFLEDKIRGCVAGFVLLTPDDEGRLYQFGESLHRRARQNVIFEGGYLTALFRDTQRVCFLQLGDLEIPSDLNGLLMERFIGHIDRGRICKTLEEWGLKRAKTEN